MQRYVTLNCDIKVQDIFTPSQLGVQRDCRFIFNAGIGFNEDHIHSALNSYFFQLAPGRCHRYRACHAVVTSAIRAGRTERVITWDPSQTLSCLAATEPTGAYGSRKRKLEALESSGQQTHLPRRSQNSLLPSSV